MKIASAPTKERLTKLINEFYYSKNYVITISNEVYNTKLDKVVGMVKDTKKGRFEFHTFDIKETVIFRKKE